MVSLLFCILAFYCFIISITKVKCSKCPYFNHNEEILCEFGEQIIISKENISGKEKVSTLKFHLPKKY